MNLQQLDFDYSLKNIPIASQQQYLKCLADKMGLLMRRMLWKAFRYDQGLSNDDNIKKGCANQYLSCQLSLVSFLLLL